MSVRIKEKGNRGQQVDAAIQQQLREVEAHFGPQHGEIKLPPEYQSAKMPWDAASEPTPAGETSLKSAAPGERRPALAPVEPPKDATGTSDSSAQEYQQPFGRRASGAESSKHNPVMQRPTQNRPLTAEAFVDTYRDPLAVNGSTVTRFRNVPQPESLKFSARDLWSRTSSLSTQPSSTGIFGSWPAGMAAQAALAVETAVRATERLFEEIPREWAKRSLATARQPGARLIGNPRTVAANLLERDPAGSQSKAMGYVADHLRQTNPRFRDLAAQHVDLCAVLDKLDVAEKQGGMDKELVALLKARGIGPSQSALDIRVGEEPGVVAYRRSATQEALRVRTEAGFMITSAMRELQQEQRRA